MTPPTPTQHGGLWCNDVLAALGDFVDGLLDADHHRQIEAHVSACENCRRFGGAYGALVGRMHQLTLPTSARAPLSLDQLRERLTEIG